MRGDGVGDGRVLAVMGGVAAAAVASQRCCGSAWDNKDAVSLTCSAVVRSCYDVTRAAIGVSDN